MDDSISLVNMNSMENNFSSQMHFNINPTCSNLVNNDQQPSRKEFIYNVNGKVYGFSCQNVTITILMIIIVNQY